jgi:GNAT superfamily N-acetyltransferase
MVNNKEIEKLIVDSLFINEKRLNSTPLDIADIRGWISPIRDGWANRISFTGSICKDETIQAVIDFFAKRKCAFAWILRPQDIHSGLSEKLLSHGIEPSYFPEVSGVYLETDGIGEMKNSNITICNVTDENLESYLDMISRAYGENTDTSVRYFNIVPEAERAAVMKYYIAYTADSEDPVGYAKTGYLQNGEVSLLMGAAVLEEYRGQGVYSELLRYRIQQGINDGIHHFISQASRNTSYNTFKRFGFKDICDLQIYGWSPAQ